MMKGIRVTCTDLETGESESREIENDYILVTTGDHYLDGIVRHGNGTTVLTVKRHRADALAPPSDQATEEVKHG